MNLVGNSLKFTTEGYVQVTLRELPHPSSSKTICIEMAVIDTGKGISKGFLKDQLFQPFSQENPLQTGTGLGLAIVNSIVRSEDVNGKVDVWSSEGFGTEIRISFEAEVEDEDDSTSVSSVTSESSIGRGHSISFLSFDMTHRGHVLSLEVLGAYAAGWYFILRDDGDILVVNGADEAAIDIDVSRKPIIILTAHRSSKAHAMRDRAEKLGCYCQILYKPIGPHHFREVLENAMIWLEESRSTSRPPIARENSDASQESVESASTIGDLSAAAFDRRYRDLRAPLTRRRSEEEPHFVRPSMAPRGVTYHVTRRVSNDEGSPVGSPSFSSPHSTISTISLADGGSILKAVAIGGEGLGRERTPKVMVVEDNVINRRVLGAFLKKKVGSRSWYTAYVTGLRVHRGGKWSSRFAVV